MRLPDETDKAFRAFFNLTVCAGPNDAWKSPVGRFYHRVEDAQSTSASPARRAAHVTKPRRNPIVLAREWEKQLAEGICVSWADLARKRKVSRARVTQIMATLKLTPQVLETVAALGDPLTSPLVTERGLRSLVSLPADEQWRAVQERFFRSD